MRNLREVDFLKIFVASWRRWEELGSLSLVTDIIDPKYQGAKVPVINLLTGETETI